MRDIIDMNSDVDVVVVGAGASGLRVATCLAARGLAVRVLEARDRVGGRLLSIPLGGERLDLGATWFWDGEQRMSELLAELGIERFAQHLAGCALYDAPPRPQRLDDNPIDQPAWRIAGGAQRLAECLAERLPSGSLRLGTPVRRVLCEHTGLRILADDLELRTAHVVLALPPALALHLLEFEPALPDAVCAVAQRTPVWMGAMCKAVAVYRQAFWRDAGLAGSAFSLLGPMRELHDMSPAGGRPGALFGFVPFGGGRVSREAVVAQLTRLFGDAAHAPIELALLDWRGERYTSPPAVEQRADYDLFGHRIFEAPHWDGRLHFASTETSRIAPGHIEGALAAADRCVAHIVGNGAVENETQRR